MMLFLQPRENKSKRTKVRVWSATLRLKRAANADPGRAAGPIVLEERGESATLEGPRPQPPSMSPKPDEGGLKRWASPGEKILKEVTSLLAGWIGRQYGYQSTAVDWQAGR